MNHIFMTRKINEVNAYRKCIHTSSLIILFILARGRVKSSSSAEGGGHNSSCGLFIVLCAFITFAIDFD